jgi:hypothetical protein
MLDRLSRQKLALGIEVTYSIIALTTVSLVLRRSNNGLVGVASFALITSLYNVVWLVALYHVAGFRFATLGTLGREAVIIAGASLGIIWLLVLLLPPLVAFITGCMILISYEVLCLRAARSRLSL